MKRILMIGLAGLLMGGAAVAQSVVGNASLSVTGTSARVALPAGSVNSPYVMIRPTTAQEVFYLLGDVTAVALTSSPALPSGGICLNVGPGTYLAAITSTSTNVLRITRMTMCPNF